MSKIALFTVMHIQMLFSVASSYPQYIAYTEGMQVVSRTSKEDAPPIHIF